MILMLKCMILLYFRSIGCFLILLFHIYWFNHFTVHNVTMTFSYGEQPLFQWISATPIIVDVFFTIRYAEIISSLLIEL